MDDVVIYGAGGLGSLVQDILEQAGRYHPVAFLDSDPARHGQIHAGLPVEGGGERIEHFRSAGVRHAIVAVGDNFARVSLAEELQARGMELVSAIHPLACLSPSSRIAHHVVIGPRATVCVHARIGPHSVLSSGTIVEHDNTIGCGVFLAPAVRLAGTVTVQDFAVLAIGATVIPGRTVGRAACVDAGAVVIRDVAANTRVAGIPAAPIKPAASSRFIPQLPRTRQPTTRRTTPILRADVVHVD